MRPPPSLRSGMTLVELLVTLAVISIVMAGTMQTLQGFQALYTVSAVQRQAGQSARMGLAAIERDLRRAGYAIDPGLAFDFTVFSGLPRDPNPADGVVIATTYPADHRCTSAGTTTSGCATIRDRTDGPDELVFYARDPRYWGADMAAGSPNTPVGRAWSVAAATNTSLTLAGTAGDRIGLGQVLQVVCPRGAGVTYVTAAASVNNPATGNFTVNVGYTPNAGDPYSQPARLGTGCLTAGSRAFAVDRFRYHVRELYLAEATNPVPFLVLDTGVDVNGDGTRDGADVLPIAAGVVDLQVAYVRPETNDPARTFGRAGTTPGTAMPLCYAGTGLNWRVRDEAIANCPGGLRVLNFAAVGAGAYDRIGYVTAGSSYPAINRPRAVRAGADAANVTEVEVHLVARALNEARTKLPEHPPAKLNRTPLTTALPATAPRWVYSTTSTVVPVMNLSTSSVAFF